MLEMINFTGHYLKRGTLHKRAGEMRASKETQRTHFQCSPYDMCPLSLTWCMYLQTLLFFAVIGVVSLVEALLQLYHTSSLMIIPLENNDYYLVTSMVCEFPLLHQQS